MVDIEDIFESTIICPSCGFVGTEEDLVNYRDPNFKICPECGYENGLFPYRLLTIREIVEGDGVYNGVRLDLFLDSLFKILCI